MSNQLERLHTEPSEVLRVRPGFLLSELDPDSHPGFMGGKKAGTAALAEGVDELEDLQEILFADSRVGGGSRSVLLVLQAMDTAGKGGIVRHVVGSVDPQGVAIASFKKPTEVELQHDFLWRIHRKTPAAGMIGVFDRSHYEDVLVTRVHNLVTPAEIVRRYDAINAFEANLVASGTLIIKVMLHISPEAQKERLTERLDRGDKYWKFSDNDIAERALWPHYQEAYQAAFDHTSTEVAPWFVVPADSKWYARLAVQHLLLDALRSMALSWPAATFDVEVEKKRLADSPI